MLTKIKSIIGLTTIFFTGCLLPSTIAEEQTVSEPLWQRAVIIASQNQDLIPGAMYAHFNEFNSKGKLKKEEESWTRLSLGSNGDLHMELAKHLENGVDITAEKKKGFDKKNNKQENKQKSKNEFGVELNDLNPFNPGNQENVTVTSLNHQESINGQPCSVFKYTRTISPGNYQIGKAWLDNSTGAPIRIDYTLDPLPAFVKELTCKVDYKNEPTGAWYPNKVEMDCKVSFLFFKAQIRNELGMDAFWKYQKK